METTSVVFDKSECSDWVNVPCVIQGKGGILVGCPA